NPQPRRTGKNQEKEHSCQKTRTLPDETRPNHHWGREPGALALQARSRRRQGHEVSMQISRQHLRFIPCLGQLHLALDGVTLALKNYSPSPAKTAGMVFIKIMKSRNRFHFSMYARSSVMQMSNEGLARAKTCQSPVTPGFTSRRRQCSEVY